jgi:hypothetical protein
MRAEREKREREEREKRGDKIAQLSGAFVMKKKV